MGNGTVHNFVQEQMILIISYCLNVAIKFSRECYYWVVERNTVENIAFLAKFRKLQGKNKRTVVVLQMGAFEGKLRLNCGKLDQELSE